MERKRSSYALPPSVSKMSMLLKNAVTVTLGVDEATLRKELLDSYQIEIGAGLGPLAGKILRIGLMVSSANLQNISYLVHALQNILK